MLIEFSVKNFRSIKDKQTLKLAKARGKDLVDSNSFSAAVKVRLLRSAVVYGANASGKSNLLHAAGVMRRLVLESSTRYSQGDLLPITPFLLSDATADAPAEFEVIFIKNGARYQYGFSASNTRIHKEWLFAYPKNRPQKWFQRTWKEEKNKYSWSFGSSFKGGKLGWRKSTRNNALFLSTAVTLNSQQLPPLHDWFRTTLRGTDFPGINTSANFTANMFHSDAQGERKEKILTLLRYADQSLHSVSVIKPFSMDDLPDDISDPLRGEILHRLSLRVKTEHLNDAGQPVSFDFQEASTGTKKLFNFIGHCLDALELGNVLLVDELHSSLHPKLVEYLVKLFHSDATNPHNAQLIFNTHDLSILNRKVFRRDQIWFIEKDKQHASVLSPLANFKVRKGRDNIALSYLSGVYGALPNIE